MLTRLDDTPWHQLPTTFDHVGTSDPRFFDRLWFAASDRAGGGALQCTMGVYQNMNVVDGGFVVIHEGRQHNVRVSRQLRPEYETVCGPLEVEVVEPFERIALRVAENASGVVGELTWRATFAPQEERHHFGRRDGRVIEDYSRYDQIGECSGWLDIDGTRVELEDWWSCRDHSWGVRERVGIPEPVTGEPVRREGSMFAFLFYSTETSGGHVQVTVRPDGSTHLTAEMIDPATGAVSTGSSLGIQAEFVDDRRPRRVRRAVLDVTDEHGEPTQFEVEAQGPCVAMTGLGYGGYRDGLGLGVWRGLTHLEHDVWDVSAPADVVMPDGSVERPVHRIQPVSVTERTADGRTGHGTGSLTFIAERPVDDDGRLRAGDNT